MNFLNVTLSCKLQNCIFEFFEFLIVNKHLFMRAFSDYYKDQFSESTKRNSFAAWRKFSFEWSDTHDICPGEGQCFGEISPQN